MRLFQLLLDAQPEHLQVARRRLLRLQLLNLARTLLQLDPELGGQRVVPLLPLGLRDIR